jgi:hypothetical protein
MSGLSNLVRKFISELSNYTYESDYLASLAIIENVYRAHAENINSNDSSRYLWRSVCQYKCQSFARKKMMGLAANIVAFLCLPFLLFLIRPTRNTGKAKASCQYLKINFHMAYQVPAILKNVTLEKAISGKYLTLRDVTFALGIFIKNFAFYPELLFKFILWIASVRPYLDSCDTHYLIQYCEYSAYSSLRKLFLNKENILVANIAHGEEFISCRSAFSSFDQYFTWEITPRAIHDALHMEYTDRFTFNPCEGFEPAPVVVTPTLGFLWPSVVDVANLDTLVAQLNNISKYCVVLVRPHPNPGYANHFDKYCHLLEAQVSDANAEDIHSFIDRCSLIVGNFSSVLVQAALRGREVVYLHDAYLASLKLYHSYYHTVNTAYLEELDKCVSGRVRYLAKLYAISNV